MIGVVTVDSRRMFNINTGAKHYGIYISEHRFQNLLYVVRANTKYNPPKTAESVTQIHFRTHARTHIINTISDTRKIHTPYDY